MAKTYKPLDTLPAGLCQRWTDWATAALKDGWTLNEGPWGQSEHDRSVVLEREHNGGRFVVWLIDRDLTDYRNGGYRPDVWTTGWFIREGVTNSGYTRWVDERGIEVGEFYNLNTLVRETGICGECHEFVGESNLTHVGFASKACADCLSIARAKYEFPGWTN